MNSNLGYFVLRFFIYILGVVQAALYTPIILSLFLFVLVIAMLLWGEFNNPIFTYLSDGTYTEKDIISTYSRYALIFSLVISLSEIIFQKTFVVSIKKRLLSLGVTLFIGYVVVFIFMITKAEFALKEAVFIAFVFFAVSFSSLLLSGLVAKFIDFVRMVFDNSGSNIVH